MSFAHPNAAFGRQYRFQDERNLPEYNSIQFYYRFEEGKGGNIFKDNIFIDSTDPLSYGANLVTNPGFDGAYVAGVAPSWTIDAGVTATEDVDDVDLTPAQRLTNMNGFAQAFRQTPIALTIGSIYYVQFGVRRISGAGNLNVKCDGLSTTSFDIANADLNLADPNAYVVGHFYGIATAATTQFEFTASATTLVIELTQVQINLVGGGNHMVMEHSLYSNADRGDNYYEFDGTTDFAKITDARQSNMDLGSSWSSVAIMRADSDGLSASKWLGTGSQRSWQAPRTTALRRLVTFWSHNGSTVSNTQTNNNTVPAYPWTDYLCIGMSFAAGVVTFYKNGVLQANLSSSISGTTIFNSTAAADLGRDEAATLYFDGRLGKQILWNGAALTAYQHRQVFNILRTDYGI